MARYEFMKCFKRTFCINTLPVMFLFMLIVFPLHATAASPCNSVYGIYENLDACNGQEVFLRGTVKGIDYSTSAKGNDYTTFLIDDGTATPLKVFSYGKLPISDGKTVSVRGNFTKALNKSGYVFYEQITTSPKNIFITGNEPEESSNIKDMLFPISIGILAILGALKAYKKYHRNKSNIGKHETGASFEDYVQRLFDQREWVIVDKAKDLSKEIGRKVESDSNPDFTFRHNATGKTVAVECKYRSCFTLGKKNEYGINWVAGDYQINKYNDYQERTRYPVFVALGVGGTPTEPKQLFLAPLFRLQYRWASNGYIRKFERDPQRKIGLRDLNLA